MCCITGEDGHDGAWPSMVYVEPAVFRMEGRAPSRPRKSWQWIGLVWLLSTLATIWIPPALAIPNPRGAVAEGGVTGIAWEESLDSAMARAAAESRPVLVYLTMPNCSICRHLEATTLSDPAVRQRLRDLVCVRLDVTVDREIAARLGAEGTPTIVMLGSDGRMQNRITGYLAPYEFLAALSSGAAGRGKQEVAEDRQSREALAAVRKGVVPAARWPDILQAFHYVPGRADLVAAILALEPFPRADLVAALGDSQLAVRLGALEVLEQAAGDDFGFDPWAELPETNAPPTAALARWQAWVANTNVVLAARFSSLTREQVGARLLDLLSGDRDRVQRARRQLIDAGAAVAEPAVDFLVRHADLPVGLADRVREVRYAVLLPARPGFDPAAQAQRLVFGNLDVQLQALRDVRVQKAAAIPVAVDFLRHPNPLVRETAVDTLIAVARRDAVPALRDLLTRESNREVIVAVARDLAGVRGKSAADVLAGLLERDDEDVVITALRSLAKNEAGAPVSAVCKRLTDPRWRVRVAALQTVSDLRSHEAADAVDKLVDDPDAFVRFTAIVTLSKVCPVDRAAKRLEKAFLASDEYKAPVLAAFGAMERSLPASFVNASTGKTAEVLLPMLEALPKCGKHGLALATALASHPDGDVACAALTVLAHNSVKSANAPLVAALQRGSRGQAVIVLEALQEEAEDRYHGSSSSDDSNFDDVLAELSETRSAGGTETEGPSPVADLLDAFLAPGKAVPTATPAKPAPPSPGITDLFDAFDATQAVAGAETPGDASIAERSPAATASSKDLVEAVHTCRGRFPNDRAVQNAALVALLRLGDTNAVTEMKGALDGLSDEYRAGVASALKANASPEALALLKRLVRDSDSTTRKAAAERLVAQAEKPEWCNALFEEAARDGTPLLIEEAFEDVLRADFKKVAALANVRQWADRFFEKPPRPALKVLAIALYEKLNRRQETERLMPLLASPDPLLRRATYRALGKLDTANRGTLLQQAATDTVEDVRAVVPALLGTGSGAWVNKFDEKESLSSWQWTSDDHRLKESERLALHRLAADPVPELRAESLIALMSVGDPFEPADLMSALDQCRDSAAMSRRAADVLESNYEKLNSRYAVLLPLLDAGRISDERRESITKRLTGPAGSTTGPALVLREAGVAPAVDVAPTGTAVAITGPAATNVLRVVFFRETGCEDCETAKAFLKALADAFPELRVEEHEMSAEGSLALNKALAERFHMPDRQRGRTPTVVAAAGTLVDSEITFDSLADLLARSLGTAW